VLLTTGTLLCWAGEHQPKIPYAAWTNGPSSDADFLPIAVWLQSPANASRYKDAGVNLYVGLWKGPTEQQLAELRKHGLRVICTQNRVGLQHKDDPTIAGWRHGDEPDNAQALPGGKGYGPPIPPARIVEDYTRLWKANPTRPVLLNLGPGVAWDRYVGRGIRTNHPEDYAEYVKGADVVSFDIYPACHEHPEVAGKFWLVAEGVSRLRQWSHERRVVWNCVECTHVSNPAARATPQQVRAEVWMALVRGFRGLIYFVHQFKPKFIEAGLLADEEMLAQVTRTNKQIHRLAAVLNTPSLADAVAVTSSPEVPVGAMAKRHQGAVYVFSVAMRAGKTTGTFQVAGLKGEAKVEVIDEGRTLEVDNGVFRDTFEPWDVHLYKINAD
jgi:hypothetical protein